MLCYNDDCNFPPQNILIVLDSVLSYYDTSTGMMLSSFIMYNN